MKRHVIIYKEIDGTEIWTYFSCNPELNTETKTILGIKASMNKANGSDFNLASIKSCEVKQLEDENI